MSRLELVDFVFGSGNVIVLGIEDEGVGVHVVFMSW